MFMKTVYTSLVKFSEKDQEKSFYKTNMMDIDIKGKHFSKSRCVIDIVFLNMNRYADNI